MNVVSPVRVECAFPPLVGSYKVDQSSFVRLLRFTPSISTNSEVMPFGFVIVQGGPGATQPGGVRPGVSHRLESPPETGAVQGTFVFQENGVIGAETEAPGEPEGMNARVERTRIAMPRGRVTAILFKRIP